MLKLLVFNFSFISNLFNYLIINFNFINLIFKFLIMLDYKSKKMVILYFFIIIFYTIFQIVNYLL